MRWVRKDEGGRMKDEKIVPLPILRLRSGQVSNLQSLLRCPLCGKRFRAEDAAQCAACALAKRCGWVMCPNCGYEFAA